MKSNKKRTLDKDLDKLGYIEDAASSFGRKLMGPGLALLFIACAALISLKDGFGYPGFVAIISASMIGAYMALNIGANDVANNMGPAVGSRALSMGAALVLAAVCETSGALIAGGDVIGTISGDIIHTVDISTPDVYISVMMAALVSAAFWIHFATWIGAPVSTTHAIVGGVMGAGIAAAGFYAVNWSTLGSIVASWIVSPFLGGAIAALLLAFIKNFIVYQNDKLAAARLWLPVLIGLMAGVFASYLALKGLRHLAVITLSHALSIGLVCGLLGWASGVVLIRRQSIGLENRNQSLRKLFTVPLILSSGLLSFAHGANDVANAVGPLAGIVDAAHKGVVSETVHVPLWVMAVGAIGLSLGLLLFGPRLISMVGAQITRLNPMRAYCVALSAAITVILASAMGLPVSSTHIAVGSVFGVGFFREWYTENSRRRFAYLQQKNGNLPRKTQLQKNREEMKRRKFVRRSHMFTIAAAWIVSVPATAILSGLLFLVLSPIM